jgi:hypothetical protein
MFTTLIDINNINYNTTGNYNKNDVLNNVTEYLIE